MSTNVRATDYEVADAFSSDMAAAGVKPSESITNALLGGGIVRFHVEGDTRGRHNGWATLYLDGRPAGAFGCHKRGIKGKWVFNRPLPTISPAEKQAFAKKKQAEREQKGSEKAVAQHAASIKAKGMLANSGPAQSDHPYLARKRIAGVGLRQLGSLILVPMCDSTGEVWNVQCIGGDGRKNFLTGGRCTGLVWIVDADPARVLVAEGAGTAAALHRATGATICAGFSAANLLGAARSAREIWPHANIVLCADDDAHLVSNPNVMRNVGIEDAVAAAHAIGARVALPPRGAGMAVDTGWDFADIENDAVIVDAVKHAAPPFAFQREGGPFGSLASLMGGK